MRPCGILLLAVAALGAISACTSPAPVEYRTDEGNDPPVDVPPGAVAIQWQKIDQLTSPVSQIRERRRLVIGSTAEWAAFWVEFHGAIVPLPELPDVDFEASVVIAATMGAKSTGGFAISIRDVFQEDGTVIPVIVETAPGPACVTLQVVTAPAAGAVVARSAGPVRFIEETRTTSCG